MFSAFFTFYFIFSLNVLPRAVISFGDVPTVQASFSFAIAVTLLFASYFINRLNSLAVVLLSFILISLIALFIPFIFESSLRLSLIFLAGISFGVGQIAFFVHFWKMTPSDSRGRVSGRIGFITLLMYFIINVVVENTSLSVDVVAILIPSLGALAVIVLNLRNRKTPERNENAEYYPEKRTVLLYLIPWMLFSLINATLAKNIVSNSSQVVTSSFLFLLLLQTVFSFVGALGGGIITDFLGRRQALALSITLYGVSIALSGIVQNLTVFSFAFAAEGLSWGILLTLYSFVIWGDLANKKNCAKMYSIGLITLYAANGVGQLSTPLSQISPVNSALIGCSIIFLSIVPLALAPELVPSSIREKAKLKKYIDQMKKLNKKQQSQG
jgi:MFS family permease